MTSFVIPINSYEPLWTLKSSDRIFYPIRLKVKTLQLKSSSPLQHPSMQLVGKSRKTPPAASTNADANFGRKGRCFGGSCFCWSKTKHLQVV